MGALGRGVAYSNHALLLACFLYFSTLRSEINYSTSSIAVYVRAR